MTLNDTKEQLPVFRCRSQLLSLIRENASGDTGETTQVNHAILQQYLYEGYANDRGNLLLSRTRRVAAMSVAKGQMEMQALLKEEA